MEGGTRGEQKISGRSTKDIGKEKWQAGWAFFRECYAVVTCFVTKRERARKERQKEL